MAKPPIKIVSTLTEQQIRRQKSQGDLKISLRVLTANLLRIVRGSGYPDDLPWQLEDSVASFQKFFESHGYFPDSRQIHNILICEFAMHEHRPWIKNDKISIINQEDRSQEEAMKFIRRGALQVAASMLVDQMTHQSRGEEEIHKGIRILDEDSPKSKRSRKPRKHSIWDDVKA